MKKWLILIKPNGSFLAEISIIDGRDNKEHATYVEIDEVIFASGKFKNKFIKNDVVAMHTRFIASSEHELIKKTFEELE